MIMKACRCQFAFLVVETYLTKSACSAASMICICGYTRLAWYDVFDLWAHQVCTSKSIRTVAQLRVVRLLESGQTDHHFCRLQVL